MPDLIDGRQLMARAQAGDIDAFGELYSRYREMVFRFVHFRAHDRQLAEDISQETFVRALRNVERWQDQGKDVGAWLVTIARNMLVDHFKSGRYRLEVTVGAGLDVGAERRDTNREGNPEAAVIEQLRDTALLRALWRLTEDQRNCLVHRFVQGLSVAETATAMGREQGAIKALAHRGVMAMTQLLDLEDWR